VGKTGRLHLLGRRGATWALKFDKITYTASFHCCYTKMCKMSAPRIYTKCPTMPQSICVGLQLCSSTATVEHAPRFGLTPNCVSLSKSSCCCMLVFQLLDWRFATQQQKICKTKKVAKNTYSSWSSSKCNVISNRSTLSPTQLGSGDITARWENNFPVSKLWHAYGSN